MDLGALSSEAHVSSLWHTVQQVEPDVQAWSFLNRTLAVEQARAADARRASGAPGALLGVAVGLKDIIDTADMPTENGTVLHAGRRPTQDATLVSRLREAGAVIMGKTVTTELATYAPGKTRNPHALTHTPGGSSSGSAAAVASGMVPMAIGTQTNGSTIRPGAFCGVVSFKPTRSTLDRSGILVQSPTFDTVGLFARTVDDVSLLWSVLADRHEHEPVPGVEIGRFGLRNLVWMPGPLRSRLEPGIESILLHRAHQWGADEGPDDLPFGVMSLIEVHRFIMEAEIARCFEHEYASGASRLSASLCGQIERGRLTTEKALHQARATLQAMQNQVDAWMDAEGIDALITASAAGPAPVGLSSTGDPVFCTLATALDLPALQLPGLTAPNGLPLGIQVISRRGVDRALLTLGSQLMRQDSLCK